MRRRRRSCHYCGTGMTKRGTHDVRSATIDHVIPKSRGGNNSPINTVMCCRKCNNEKGNFTGVEYRAWIEAGRPNREIFKSQLPDFKDRYLNGETGTHFDWFVKLYVGEPKNRIPKPQMTATETSQWLKEKGNAGPDAPTDPV